MRQVLRIVCRVMVCCACAFVFLVNLSACGGGGTDGDASSDLNQIGATAKIVLPDGSERQFADRPLPVRLKIKVDFSVVVDPAQIEPLITLLKGKRSIAKHLTWNETNTEVIIKPDNALDFQGDYTLQVGSADSVYFSESFRTMVSSDVDGDGKADLVYNDGKNGYLFWGDSLKNSSNADANFKLLDVNIFIPDADLNDDGYADVLSSSFNDDNVQIMNIYYGNPGRDGFSGEREVAGSDLSLSAIAGGGNKYIYVRSVADIDDDGRGEVLATGSCFDGNGSCIYFFKGPISVSRNANESDFKIKIYNAGAVSDMFYAADVTGDGVVDLVVNGYNYDDKMYQTYVFKGGKDFSSKSDYEADIVFTGERPDDDFMVRKLIDINGDGVMDIVARSNFGDSMGRVYVFFGGEVLTGKGAKDADLIISGPKDGSFFGSTIGIGDYDGDGKNDLAASRFDPVNEQMHLSIYLGEILQSGNTGASSFEIDYNNKLLDTFRFSDLNSDGFDDLYMRSFNDNAMSYDRWNDFVVYFGGENIEGRDWSTYDVTIKRADAVNDIRVRDINDFNGDGYGDFVFFADVYENNAWSTRVYVSYGSGGSSVRNVAESDIAITCQPTMTHSFCQ